MSVWFTVNHNSFSLVNLSFQLHTARRYCFLPQKLQAPFILKSFSNRDAWLPLPVSITIRTRFQHPAVEWGLEIHNKAHFIWLERTVSCFSCFLLLSVLLEILFCKNYHGSLFMGSVKAALNVSIGMDKHVNRSLAKQEDSAQFRLNLWSYIPQSQCTWPAGVGDRGGEGVLGLTTFFFSLWHAAITLAPCGEQRGHSEAFILARV